MMYKPILVHGNLKVVLKDFINDKEISFIECEITFDELYKFSYRVLNHKGKEYTVYYHPITEIVTYCSISIDEEVDNDSLYNKFKRHSDTNTFLSGKQTTCLSFTSPIHTFYNDEIRFSDIKDSCTFIVKKSNTDILLTDLLKLLYTEKSICLNDPSIERPLYYNIVKNKTDEIIILILEDYKFIFSFDSGTGIVNNKVLTTCEDELFFTKRQNGFTISDSQLNVLQSYIDALYP